MASDAHRINLEPDPFVYANISQGFRTRDLVFLSGQVALDEQGGVVGPGDFDAQADQAVRNVRRALEAAGSGLDKVIKVTIYLTDMAHRAKVIEGRKRWFRPPYPADTLVAVAALGRPEFMIEIDAVALTDGVVHDA